MVFGRRLDFEPALNIDVFGDWVPLGGSEDPGGQCLRVMAQLCDYWHGACVIPTGNQLYAGKYKPTKESMLDQILVPPRSWRTPIKLT